MLKILQGFNNWVDGLDASHRNQFHLLSASSLKTRRLPCLMHR